MDRFDLIISNWGCFNLELDILQSRTGCELYELQSLRTWELSYTTRYKETLTHIGLSCVITRCYTSKISLCFPRTDPSNEEPSVNIDIHWSQISPGRTTGPNDT